jgi:hypothetical protein
MKIDMMRVEIITNIRALTCPAFECNELLLRLAHMSVEIRKVPKTANTLTGISINGIPSLVDFNSD